MKPDIVAGFLGAAALFTVFYFNEPSPSSDVLLMQIIQLIVIALTAGTLIAATLRGAPFDKMLASTGATILLVLSVPASGPECLGRSAVAVTEFSGLGLTPPHAPN